MIKLRKWTYEIDDSNTIRVWEGEPSEDNVHFLYQPVHPDGREWSNREEAESWIVDLLMARTDY